jgi:hypothetical protein
MDTRQNRVVVVRVMLAWLSLSVVAQGGNSPFTFNTTGSLSVARSNHTATLLQDGKVLVAGEYDNRGNVFAAAEVYDPGHWNLGCDKQP